MNRKIIKVSPEMLKRLHARSRATTLINMHEMAEHCPVCGSIDVVGGCCRHCHAHTDISHYLCEA